MFKTIAVDSSCLILLDKICELELLHSLFREVVVTKEIADEFGKELPSWVVVKNASNELYQKILEISLGKGEASLLAFAIENPETLIIVDDNKARKYAEKLDICLTGTLGVLVSAKLYSNPTGLGNLSGLVI